MGKAYCKYCGMGFQDVRTLVINRCQNNPNGKGGTMYHELYEGSEKAEYACKFCGMKYRSLRDLTNNVCQRRPAGTGRFHEPAL